MSSQSRVLILPPIPPELRQLLSGKYETVDYGGTNNRLPEAPGFRVAVTTSMGGASAELMAALPDLGLIACNGSGLDLIDLEEAARRGIVVCNTPGVVTEDTADFTMALIYATVRRTAEGDRFVRAGRWAKERMTPSRSLVGRKLGIVGLGKIGAAVAGRAAALGMQVHYTGPSRKQGVDYAYIDGLSKLAEIVDILVLCCPGGAETRNLVDAEILERLGPDGYLINASRGSVVDESALIKAMSSHAIAGAGLDVFASEPDINPAYLDLENIVLEPHYAAVTKETRNAMAALLDNAIESYFDGAAAMTEKGD